MLLIGSSWLLFILAKEYLGWVTDPVTLCNGLVVALLTRINLIVTRIIVVTSCIHDLGMSSSIDH